MTVLGLDLAGVLGAFAICFLAATVQGTVGFGFAMLAVPLCALVDPRFAPVPQALLALVLVIPMAWRERSHIEWRGVAWILVGRIPGVALGIALLKLASTRTLDLLLAGCVIGAVVALATGVRLVRVPVTQFIGGMLSSIGSVVSSIGGPPIALLYRDERGPILRANLAAVFAVGLLMTLTARAATGEISRVDLTVAALLWPAILAALWLSRRLAARVEGPRLRQIVLALAGLAGVLLVIRAW